MRYYNIIVTDPTTNAPLKRSDGTAYAWSSLYNGKFDPGALQVELDISVSPFATPTGADYLVISGISIQDISQAANLNFMKIAVYGGMSAGLPLANPAQQGLLTQGLIQQCFGVWVGTSMTLNMNITAAQNPGNAPKNLTLDWKAGTPLSTAIMSSLLTAFPGYKANINISPNLVLANDEPGFYGTMPEFAQYVKQMSADIIVGKYRGVDILLTQNTFTVYDGTTQGKPKAIAFNDLVGQPTWQSPYNIQLTTVMRGDLSVNDYITLPNTLTTSTFSSQSQYRQNSIFQGTFQIDLIRHVGNFRSHDGASWVTVIDVHATTATLSDADDPGAGAAGGFT